MQDVFTKFFSDFPRTEFLILSLVIHYSGFALKETGDIARIIPSYSFAQVIDYSLANIYAECFLMIGRNLY